MILTVFELSIFFFFLAILLLINVLWSNIWWQLKAFLIIVSLAFFVTSYQSIDDLLGRPTHQSPPEEYTYVASLIHEPSKRNNYPGAIYLLTIDDIGYKMYELPYSKETREMLQRGDEARSRGAQVKVKRRKGGLTDIEGEVAEQGKRNGVYYEDLEGHRWDMILIEPITHTKPEQETETAQ